MRGVGEVAEAVEAAAAVGLQVSLCEDGGDGRRGPPDVPEHRLRVGAVVQQQLERLGRPVPGVDGPGERGGGDGRHVGAGQLVDGRAHRRDARRKRMPSTLFRPARDESGL